MTASTRTPSSRTLAGLRRCELFDRLYVQWAIEHERSTGQRATQQRLADELGVDSAAISRWRSGHHDWHPGWPILQRLAALSGRCVVFTGDVWPVVEAQALPAAELTVVCEPGDFDAVRLFCACARLHEARSASKTRGALAVELGVQRQHYSSWRNLGRSVKGVSPPPWATVLRAAALAGHVVVMSARGWGVLPLEHTGAAGVPK